MPVTTYLEVTGRAEPSRRISTSDRGSCHLVKRGGWLPSRDWSSDTEFDRVNDGPSRQIHVMHLTALRYAGLRMYGFGAFQPCG